MSDPFAIKIDAWDLLVTSLRPMIRGLPGLQDQHRSLEGVVEEARGLLAEQELLSSRLRQVEREQREAGQRGEVLRKQLAYHVRRELGLPGEELILHGARGKARRKARRRGSRA